MGFPQETQTKINSHQPKWQPIKTQHYPKLNMKYNCSGPPAVKSQRVGYQSNQKLLHHYQH